MPFDRLPPRRAQTAPRPGAGRMSEAIAPYVTLEHLFTDLTKHVGSVYLGHLLTRAS